MSEEIVPYFITKTLKILQDLDDSEIEEFEKWMGHQDYKKDLTKMKQIRKSDKTLRKIGRSLKQMVPVEAELSSEDISNPSIGDQTHCNKINTCHVDEFLYDDAEVNELVKEGKIKRHYCADCNSRNIKDLTFISHSMSKDALQYIFRVLVPGDLEGKQVLDIGSRLGSVIFAAYHITNASTIIGVEMNKEFTEIQQQIIDKFSMDNKRIKVIHSDILECSDTVQNSDFILLNVLDFFVNAEKQKEMWRFFKKSFKKGTYLITNRTVPETLGYLNLCDEFSDWLSVCKPFQLENEKFFDIEDFNFSEFFLYNVN